MFEELGRIIREEVVLTIFHVEIQMEDAAEQLQPAQAPQQLEYEHESAQGAERRGLRRRAEAGRERAPGHRAQRSVLVRVGQEVQALPRRMKLREPMVPPPSSSFHVAPG